MHPLGILFNNGAAVRYIWNNFGLFFLNCVFTYIAIFFPDAVIEGSALFLSSNFANSILYFHIAVINAVSVGGMLWH